MKKILFYSMAVIILVLIVGLNVSVIINWDRLSSVWPVYYISGLGLFVCFMYFKLGRTVK